MTIPISNPKVSNDASAGKTIGMEIAQDAYRAYPGRGPNMTTITYHITLEALA